jgi:hypothetical protein
MRGARDPGNAVRAASESARLDRSQEVPAAGAHDQRNPLSDEAEETCHG